MRYLRNSQIFFILLRFIEVSSGRDTLSTGQTLKDGDFLLSAKETFTLRFFSFGTSADRYLGIWNYKISDNRVVWVANRDIPVKDTSGVLSFQKSNNLVIYGPDLKIPIWTTNFLGPGKNYSAQLEDTGNLVVFQEDNKRVIAWQSFDHPTDTWLSQMKFGVNLKTGFSWSLRSWKSLDDPGTGEYSFRIDKDNRELTGLTIYKGSDKIWRSGPLNGRAHLIAEMSTDPTINLTYVNSKDEVYLMYSVHNLKMNSMIRLNHLGIAVWMTMFPDSFQWKVIWQAPEFFCDNYGRCGPNGNCKAPSTAHVFNCDCLPGSKVMSQRDYDAGNKSGGCVPKHDRNDCRNGEGFFKLPGTEMPDTATARVDRIQGLKECEELCLIDCNCTAYANVLEMGNACVMWYGDLMDTKQIGKGGVDLFVRADVNGTRNSKQQHYSSSNKKRLVATLVTSVGVAIFIVVFILCWLTHKRKGGLRSRAEQRHDNLLNGPDKSTELVVERQKCGDLPLFDLISLIEATNNFSHENRLGQGGFGSVYKGTLKNGQEIAVKRLSDTSKQGLEEFKNEATLISKHTHRNLVRLLGCCAQQEEKLLIYEFMPNKSLDSLIFEKTKSSCLDWEQRINIIMGITRGMVYLHHDCTLRIIHRDLKASNVLLDAQMNPKIVGKFGNFPAMW